MSVDHGICTNTSALSFWQICDVLIDIKVVQSSGKIKDKKNGPNSQESRFYLKAHFFSRSSHIGFGFEYKLISVLFSFIESK